MKIICKQYNKNIQNPIFFFTAQFITKFETIRQEQHNIPLLDSISQKEADPSKWAQDAPEPRLVGKRAYEYLPSQIKSFYWTFLLNLCINIYIYTTFSYSSYIFLFQVSYLLPFLTCQTLQTKYKQNFLNFNHHFLKSSGDPIYPIKPVLLGQGPPRKQIYSVSFLFIFPP